MFNDIDNFKYKYAPILSLSPSEMTAIEELPEKDKDLILPIFPLKGWSSSNNLIKSNERIRKSIGVRKWIADIDFSFIENNATYKVTGNYPRDVFYEIKELTDPKNGYEKWYSYLSEIPEAVPALQLKNLNELESQILLLSSLQRGLAVIFSLDDIESGISNIVIEKISSMGIEDLFIIFDIGLIGKRHLDSYRSISSIIRKTHEEAAPGLMAVSASSFPSNFGGSRNGENTIYERLLHNKISQEINNIRLIYSDYGSARAFKQSGGGGIPAPRIDYPLKNDWRFVRREFKDPKSPEKGEKEELYTEAAQEIINRDYWIESLHLWGTQIIELTSQGDKFGINSPQKATAVRINIHLYNQLHYEDKVEDIDTDEDWID